MKYNKMNNALLCIFFIKDISVYASPESTLHGVQYVSFNIERRERADIFTFKKLLPKNWLVFIFKVLYGFTKDPKVSTFVLDYD